MYNTASELFDRMEKEKKGLIEIIMEKETELTGLDDAGLYDRLWARFCVMRDAATKALGEPQKTHGGLISGDAKRMNDYNEKKGALSGAVLSRAMALALSSSEVNASMGKICAAPTAGSCGIVPATLIAATEAFEFDRRDVLDALIVAGAVGELITKNATVSGAEGGCQAECGAAAAMAAAGASWLRSRDADVCFHAAAIALQNVMGLICDPVAGLVEEPCAKRNASGVANAFCASDMALSGIKSVIPFDETVSAMAHVGRLLPRVLKETAMGGIAATKTGLEIRKRIAGAF